MERHDDQSQYNRRKSYIITSHENSDHQDSNQIKNFDSHSFQQYKKYKKMTIICICIIAILLFTLWVQEQSKKGFGQKVETLETLNSAKAVLIKSLKNDLQQKTNQTLILKEKYQSKESTSNYLDFQQRKVAKQLSALEKQKQQLNSKSNQVQTQLKQKEFDVQKILKDKNDQIKDLQTKLKERNVENANLQKKLKEKKAQIQKELQQESKVDIKNESKDYLPLPIDPLRKDSNNKGIADVLYKSEETRKYRETFIQERINFVNKNDNIQWAPLIKYNLIDSKALSEEAIIKNKNSWLRLQNKFRLSVVKEEMPICVLSSSYNNNAHFRIEANLNSVFFQNYTNFKHVVINDVSTDGSNEVYRSYYDFYRIDKSKYVYIQNSERKTALENLYLAALKHCSKDSIIMIVDGDDELIGRNTLQLFNWAFQTKKAGVIYTNFYSYVHNQKLQAGWTSQYDQNVKRNNLFRDTGAMFSHLRAARAQLFHELKPKDLQDEKGQFFKATSDVALFLPLMELSCGRVFKVQNEINLLYNMGTGINEFSVNAQNEKAIDIKIHTYPKYECSKTFNQKMSK